jgi:hypothetical protein
VGRPVETVTPAHRQSAHGTQWPAQSPGCLRGIQRLLVQGSACSRRCPVRTDEKGL